MDAQTESRFASLGLRTSDVAERFIRGSGPGGQKINKTSSTVWLRHAPSGIEVRCQAERSQAANRRRAWSELLDRIAAQTRLADQSARQLHEKKRRQHRQKSYGQKIKMIQAKKHRAKSRAGRVRVDEN